MNLTDKPEKIVIPFANTGDKVEIPVDSQIGITPGAASLTDGFPPLTSVAVTDGGVPPHRTDFNGILNEMSAADRWSQAGAGYPFDSVFITDPLVNGYPKGARVMRSDSVGYWLNKTDGNTTDPETGAAAAAGWVPDTTNGVTSVSMTNTNVTLNPLQYGKPVIVITGVLSTNVNLIFPAIQGQWSVFNNTTGAFAITAKTASGTGVTLTPNQIIVGDAVNIYFATPSVAGAGTVVNSITALRALLKTGTPNAFLTGYYGPHDGGGGPYTVDLADTTSADNGGTIIVATDGGRWKLNYTGVLSVHQFGAKGDGSTDDRLSIQSAFFVGDVSFNNNLTYFCNSTTSTGVMLRLPSNRNIYGNGATIKAGASLNTDVISLLLTDTTFVVGITHVNIYNLIVDGNRAVRSGGGHSGMGMYIACSSYILLFRCQTVNCPSDGFQIQGDTATGGLSDNVVVFEHLSDNNYRNGNSNAGTRNCHIWGGTFSNTNGASPQAGIDCEPDGATSPNVDLKITNVRCTGNSGDGLLVANSASGQRIIITNLTSQGNTLFGYETTAPITDVKLLGFFGGSNGSGDFATGSHDILLSQIIKAKVTFDASTTPPTIIESFNIGATITRSATGFFNGTFISNPSSGDYAVSGMCVNTGGNLTGVSFGASANTSSAWYIGIENGSGVSVNPTKVSLIFI